MSSDDEDIQRDEPAAMPDMASGNIYGIMEMDPYISCPKTSCNNKKMVTLREDIELYFMFCNSFQSRYKTNSCNNYLRAVLLMNSNGNEKKITAFLPHIKKMYESRGIEFVFSFDRRELMSSMMNILPIEVKYSLVNNTVKNLICKRLHNE